MIVSKRTCMFTLLFLVMFYGITINSLDTYVSTIPNATYKELINISLINGQKLTFNMTMYISIFLMGFFNEYKNILCMVRFKTNSKFIFYYIKRGLMCSLFIILNIAILQLIILIRYNCKMDISVFTTTIILNFIYSFSSFSLINVLYLYKLNSQVSLVCFIIERFAVLIFCNSFVFLFQNINLNFIIYWYIYIELILTNILAFYLSLKRERLVLRI